MKRLHKASLPTTDSIAETAVADGFMLPQRDHAGIWAVEHNTENRPAPFTRPDGQSVAEYTYACTPYGLVTTSGSITQPLQWSSEFADTETDLIYYNYRHYNPVDGRWLSRDPIGEDGGMNLYVFIENGAYLSYDRLGKKLSTISPDDAYFVPRYGIIKSKNGRRILGETASTWPSSLGSCFCGNELLLSPEAVALIDVFFYVNEKEYKWQDNFGQNVEEHEMYHVISYVSYWNAFVYKAIHTKKDMIHTNNAK